MLKIEVQEDLHRELLRQRASKERSAARPAVMHFYLDSSAVVKRYAAEQGGAWVK